MSSRHPKNHFWATLAAFDDEAGAEPLHQLLRGEGFESRIADERKLQRLWFLAQPQAGVHVQVAEDRFPAAKDTLVNSPRGEAVLRDAIRCPSCNSSRVQYPQMTRKFILPTLVAQLLVLFGLIRRECYCEDCQYTWVRERKPEAASPRGRSSIAKAKA